MAMINSDAREESLDISDIFERVSSLEIEKRVGEKHKETWADLEANMLKCRQKITENPYMYGIRLKNAIGSMKMLFHNRLPNKWLEKEFKKLDDAGLQAYIKGIRNEELRRCVEQIGPVNLIEAIKCVKTEFRRLNNHYQERAETLYWNDNNCNYCFCYDVHIYDCPLPKTTFFSKLNIE